MSYRKLDLHPLNSLLRSTLARTAAGALGAAAPLAVLANPTGGQVVGGTATIGSAGANGLVITQGSQKAIINWQQFNVGNGQYVQFVQPSSSAVVLNRVTGSNPSSIFGDIIANGQVFLVNPNGVYFAPGASIDVGGLVASSLDLSNADFMSGRYVFSKDRGAPDGGVINSGNIQTAPGGYVVLAGDYSKNFGSITAQTGRVVMAAGDAARLTLDSDSLISYVVDGKTLARLAGVLNAGQITANGGLVVMTADVAEALTATAVNNTGFITAHSVSEHGGEIVLEAQGGGIQNSGVLDASATSAGVAGGTVIVHATHGDTVLTPNSQLDVSGAGKAGGGFIDVSGHEITLKGFLTGGKGGKLLLDPSTITIENGGVNSFQCSGCEGGVIHPNFIEYELNHNIDLTIVASGSIHHSAAATTITATGGTGKLSLKIGTATVNSLSGSLHRITGSNFFNNQAGGVQESFSPSQNGTINLTGMTINIKGGFDASASKGTVKLGNVTAGNISVTGEYINVGNLHATGAGGISIRATGPTNSGSLTGGTMTADNGPVTIIQLGGHTGISIGAVQAAGGVDVSNGDGPPRLDVTINGNVTGNRVNIGAGDGDITVNGNVKATNGDVTITARAGGSSTHSGGNVHVTGNVTALNSGNVRIGAFGGGSGEAANGGGNIKVGNIAAAGNVEISASYSKTGHVFEVQTGTITAGNSSAVRGGVFIDMNGAGAVLKTGAIFAQGPRTAPCSCEGGPVRGGDIVININNNGGLGSVSVGGAKTLHGLVSISDAKAPVTVSGDITAGSNVTLTGRTINFGNITAVGNTVRISADTVSSVNHAAITQTPGTTITARFINVDLNASYGGAIHLANLTASSSKGSAGVTVNARSIMTGNSIVIGGNITVSGKGDTAAFSSAMPGGGAPVAAFVDLHASGSAAAAHPVTVTGNISVTGHAGAFNVPSHGLNSCGECGATIAASGKGGEALVEITAENAPAQIQGTTTLKGTDAELMINAPTIKTGAISVTGSGHSIDLTVSIDTGGTDATLTSSNDIGHASVILSGSHSGAATAITTGNVSVSGKGSAQVQMGAKNITTGNISVTASAATGSRHITGSHVGGIQHYGAGSYMPGIFNFRMNNGTFTAGHAEVLLGNSSSRALTVTTGNISVTGVGEADINIAGDKIQTGSLNATAAAGKVKGSFSSSNEAGAHHQKFNVDGGEATINLQTSSGTATAIVINGGVTATGPTADVNLFGRTVTVSKGITVTAKGGHVSVSGSGTGGSGFHSSVTAPGPLSAIAIGGVGTTNAGSINVGGTVSVKGPGLVGIAITGAKVTLGGLSASASAAEKYKLVSTQPTDPVNDTFTGGSVAVLVFDESGGALTGPAKINGNVTISAPHGDVALGSQLDATGQVKVTGMDINSNLGTVVTHVQELAHLAGGNSGSGGPDIPSSAALAPVIGAAGISMTATAGSVDLTGATLTTPATGVVTLKASKDIILSGVTINVGTFSANAGSTIHNGGATGTLTANGLALTAGKDINLSSTQITVGKGSVASLASDPTLLQALAAAGLSPNTPKPNAYFNAGGTLTLAKFTLTGDYLYLQAGTITMLGPLSAPADSVVQFAPTTGAATIGVEQNPGTGSVLNLSNSLLLSLFPGTTLVLGNGSETGAVTLGNDGTVNIGSSNLIVDTTGTITGLDNIISTGLVSSVESLLASALAPPTPSEIDPNSSNNNNAAGKHHEPGDEDPNAGAGGGTISQTSDAGGACH